MATTAVDDVTEYVILDKVEFHQNVKLFPLKEEFCLTHYSFFFCCCYVVAPPNILLVPTVASALGIHRHSVCAAILHCHSDRRRK